LFQFPGDLLPDGSWEINCRVVHNTTGTKEKGLYLGEFGLTPIEIGQSVKRLFNLDRRNNGIRSGV